MLSIYCLRGFHLVVAQFYLACSLQPLSPTAMEGDGVAISPLLPCFEEEDRANMSLAAGLLLLFPSCFLLLYFSRTDLFDVTL